MNYDTFRQWVFDNFGTTVDDFVTLLNMSPSSKGYIQGAASELLLKRQLEAAGYTVERIKEKPAGGYDEKKPGYKGDFLIHKENEPYYVVECKGIKTNAEFRAADETEEYTKVLPRSKAINFLKKYININKEDIYNKGLRAYNKVKEKWEAANPGSIYPSFSWNRETPGPDSPDLSPYFSNLAEIRAFINDAPDEVFTEDAFRNGRGIYKMIQTHKPSTRKDPETGCEIAAPQRILCKRFSTKSRISRFQCAGWGLIPLVHICPGRVGRYARRYGVNAVSAFRESYIKGNQPTWRSLNMISSWLSTISQFWHRACQCLTIR